MMENAHKEAKLTTVGILYPGNSKEEDFIKMNKFLGSNVHLSVVHTELHSEDLTLEILQKSGNEETLVDGAIKLADESLDSIVWASSGGSFTYGWEGAQNQAYGLYEAVAAPASNASFAFVEALHHLAISSVAVAAAYPDDLMQMFREFFTHGHIEVIGHTKSFTASAIIAGEVKKQAWFDLIDKINEEYPKAKAILLPEHAMHVIKWIGELEKYAGKPVLTSNQVSAWYGLKLAGHKRTYSNLGRLFSEDYK
jgi:maleate cis-trans isomerase